MKDDKELQERAVLLEKTVKQWFKAHPKVKSVRAKDLAEYLTNKKVIPSATIHPKLVLYRFLDKLFAKNLLRLVPAANELGGTWYFSKSAKFEWPQNETALHTAMRKYQ